MRDDDAIGIGFLIAGFAWTLWWNLDWRRYLRFYGVRSPTYPVWVEAPSRIFFAMCSSGAGLELGQRLLQRRHPVQFYFECLLDAVALFALIVAMVFMAEMTMKRRESKVIPRR